MVDAPGEPGQPPRWVATGKDGVGRSLCDDARVWFTLGRGILNEIAYPRIEQTAVRDFGLIVTDGAGLFAEERRDCDAETVRVAPGVPAYHITGTHQGGLFRLHKRLIADPRRPAVLLRVQVEDLRDDREGMAPLHGLAPLRVHALLAPHLVNAGGTGTAWIGDYKGQEMLFADAQGTAVAMAAGCGWRARSAGYAGISDGWQDLSRHGEMRWQYERALNGTVALTGELDLREASDGFVVCLAFGRIWTEAAMRARAALLDGFEELEAGYVAGWSGWLDRLPESPFPMQRTSLMVLRSHECPSMPGARIGSLGVPWAALQSSDEPSACHLVRPRDVVAGAVALLAAGDPDGLGPALSYLQTVQEADGHWPKNFWLDGMTAWQGLQLDETAHPVLLADLAWRGGRLDAAATMRVWPMVRAAALALVRHHPLAGQDRWGRDDGPRFATLGAVIAALLAAAGWAARAGEPELERFLGDTADCLHELLGQVLDEAESGAEIEPDPDIVSLVRFGVLEPDDARVRRALAAVDAGLRVATPGGPAWCARGEAGLAPRPVLALERAMLAVAAGEPEEALALLRAAEACAGAGGMLPERADGRDGRGGTVMPHLWTHAEHVILLRSVADGAPFDRPPQPAGRYGGGRAARVARWRHDGELREMPRGRPLRIELPVAADLHWSSDGWEVVQDTPVAQAGPGLFVAELPTAALAPGSDVVFTWRERGSGAWLGVDHHVTVR